MTIHRKIAMFHSDFIFRQFAEDENATKQDSAGM